MGARGGGGERLGIERGREGRVSARCWLGGGFAPAAGMWVLRALRLCAWCVAGG